MNILVTGGAGFIGSHITERLLSLGHDVTVFDDLSTGKEENLQEVSGHSRFSFIKGSIRDLLHLRDVIRIRRIQRICHQAARPSVVRSIEDPGATHEINVTGTLNVLIAAREAGCMRVVMASSSSIYGDTPIVQKREDMPRQPCSPYAASKAAGELYMKVFQNVFGLQTISLRYFNVYGPRQDPSSHYSAVIPKFIQLALRGKPLPIEGDGLQTRDFTNIEDVVHANVLALMIPETKGECVNIGFGEQTRIRSLAELIIDKTGSSSQIVHVAPRPGDVRDSLSMISLAKDYLGYQPQHRLADGLSITIDWYRKNPPSETV